MDSLVVVYIYEEEEEDEDQEYIIKFNQCYESHENYWEFRFRQLDEDDEEEEDAIALSDLTPSNWIIFGVWEEEDSCPEGY